MLFLTSQKSSPDLREENFAIYFLKSSYEITTQKGHGFG